jgi:hypothetical protein
MNRNTDQTHEQVGRQRDTSRRGGRRLATRVLASAALLGAIIAGLGSLGGGAGRTPSVAHANALVPTVGGLLIQPVPVGVDALGTNFPPGGLVHVDLVVSQLPSPIGTPAPGNTPITVDTGPQIIASVDTVASFARSIPIGNGRFFHVNGGTFDVTLTSPSPFCGTNSQISYGLVATYVATGAIYTSPSIEMGPACN